MKYGSLFAGIGGFDAGLDDAGMECVWQCEIDRAARGVLSKHWPKVPKHPDVLSLPLDTMERPDLICGGSPCQAFSVAGKRMSLADARGNLTLAFVTVCDYFDPEWVVWENVPGVLSTNDNAFGSFLGALVGADNALPPIGDDGGWPSAGVVVGPKRAVGWRVLDAQYFGVAQRRRRVFLVGHSGGSVERVTQVLFEPESVRRHSPPSREKGQRVADSLTSGSHPGSNAPGRHREDDANIVCGTLAASGAGTDRPAGQKNETSFLVIGIDKDKNATEDFMGTLQAHGSGGMQQYVAHSLLAKGNSSHDPTLETYIPCYALAENIIGRTEGNGGNDQGFQEERSFTLNTTGVHAVTHALRADGFDASEDGTGRGTPIVPVAFDTTQVTSKANRNNPKPGDPCHPLSSGAHPPAIAFDAAIGQSNRGNAVEAAETLRAGCHGALPMVGLGMAVRRLTPVECERLQGFEDGWTEFTDKGPQADGPRYKQLGNAVNVAVSKWLGKRIAIYGLLSTPLAGSSLGRNEGIK